MFQRFIYWYQRDPKALVKILFWVGVVVFMGIFVWAVVALNQNLSNNTSNQQTEEINQDNDSSKVNFPTFKTADGLSQVIAEEILLKKQVYFDEENNILYPNLQANLVYDGQTISETRQFLPSSIYFADDNIIINTLGSTSIYLKTSKQFINAPANLSQLTPVDLDQPTYVYLDLAKEQIEISASTSMLSFRNSQKWGVIEPSLNSVGNLEIKVLNQKPYLFVYENINNTGELEIWFLSEDLNQKVFTETDVAALEFGDSQVLITKSGESNNNYILDFSSSISPKSIDLNALDQLLENNVLPQQITADRCEIGLNNQVYCLVKKQPARSTNPDIPDQIIVYNWQTENLELPNANVLFSAASLIYNSKAEKLYIVGQAENKLYEFNF